MNLNEAGRMISVIAGVCTVFGLKYVFSAPFYIAIPAGLALYLIIIYSFAAYQRAGRK